MTGAEPSRGIRVVARLRALPGKSEELISLLLSLAVMSREEFGCRSYRVCVDEQQSDVVTLLEHWDSRRALDEHFASEHFESAATSLRSLLAAPADIMVLTER